MKHTLLDHMEEDLHDRKITILATNRKENCILAEDKNHRAIFIYTTDSSHEMIFETDLLSHVSISYSRVFKSLLKKTGSVSTSARKESAGTHTVRRL
jgi:hypothetical protein